MFSKICEHAISERLRRDKIGHLLHNILSCGTCGQSTSLTKKKEIASSIWGTQAIVEGMNTLITTPPQKKNTKQYRQVEVYTILGSIRHIPDLRMPKLIIYGHSVLHLLSVICIYLLFSIDTPVSFLQVARSSFRWFTMWHLLACVHSGTLCTAVENSTDINQRS